MAASQYKVAVAFKFRTIVAAAQMLWLLMWLKPLRPWAHKEVDLLTVIVFFLKCSSITQLDQAFSLSHSTLSHSTLHHTHDQQYHT